MKTSKMPFSGIFGASKHTSFAGAGAAVLLGIMVVCGRFASTASAAAPNIVVIYADDLGYGDTGSYGATAIPTPNIDKLAKSGLRFTNAYCTAATCTPSRYSMLTGEYAWRNTEAHILQGDASLLLDPGSLTLPAILQNAGYETAVIGKWHLGLGEGKIDWNKTIRPGPLEVGFDYSFIFPATNDRVPCVYVEGHRVVNGDPADPIAVNYKKRIGSDPTGASNPEMLRYQPTTSQHAGTIVNAVSRIGFMSGGKKARWKDEKMPELFTSKAIRFIKDSKKPFFLYLALSEPHAPRLPNPRFVGKTKLGPRGDSIVQLDWEVGQIMAAIKDLGLSENTLIVFTSDNGPIIHEGYFDGSSEKNGAHKPAGPYRGGKYSAFEGGTRIPLIVNWPGHVKPGVSDAMISQVDFLASFAALTGEKFDKAQSPDSRNMIRVLLGESDKGRETVIQQGTARLALRNGDWKLIQTIRPKLVGIEGFGPLAETQLFNLASDPGETHNLAAQKPEKLAEMQALLESIRSN